MSMLLITPMLVAQNATLSLWEENLEQLSADEEERNWEDDVCALAERQRRNAVHMQIEHDLRHLEKIARHGKRAHRAADLERAVIAHRLVFSQIDRKSTRLNSSH